MGKTVWDDKADYLESTRTVWFNGDYLEFLLRKVLRVDKPVDVADFGCGTGFLARALMPLLPAGSSYAGFDKSEALVAHARAAFADAPYPVSFARRDLLDEPLPPRYDLVVCQALLMHIPGPARMLARMAEAAKPGGILLCVEPDWNVSNAAMYIDGLDVGGYCNLGILQKLWKHEREAGGPDRCVGTKVPAMMRSLGLEGIGVRMNDCVRFANPDGDAGEYALNRDAFLADGWGGAMGDEAEFVDALVKRGVGPDEALCQYRCEKEMRDFVRAHSGDLCALNVPPSFITFGRKPA